MNLFGIPEARHFCKFSRRSGSCAGPLQQFVDTSLKGHTSIKEGTSAFDEYRDCFLRDTERCIFLSISLYRRSLDLMMPGSSSWAHVTLYYSSFYAARALLGLFGGWVNKYGKKYIEVSKAKPGLQELTIRAVSSTFGGSHQKFWELFYNSMPPLFPWVDSKFRFALEPVSGKSDWLIQNRNDVNYDTHTAFQLIRKFQVDFNKASFPGSLPGVLGTQYGITDGLLSILLPFANQFGIATDALDILTPAGSRKHKSNLLIFKAKPHKLLSGAKLSSLIS